MWLNFPYLAGVLSRNKRRTIARRPRVATCRPRLETLENRCLLTAGALNPTFGNGAGYVTTSLSTSSDMADSVLVQPDGRILVTGESFNGSRSAALVRYNADGSLDNSFGKGGKAFEPYTGGTPHAALYPTTGTANDGKIVLAGFTGAVPLGNFSVVRFNSNGTLDATFGSKGSATANFGSTLGTWGAATAIVQSDGKIVAVGSSSDEKTLELARWNVDGSLDTTFGQSGLVTTSLGGDVLTSNQSLTNLLLQTNGGLIAAMTGSGHWDLVGYNPNGSLNTSFGIGGIVKSPQAGNSGDRLWGSALYPTEGTVNDGKLVLVGQDGSTSTPEMARRYNTDGSLDLTFGTGGTLLTNNVLLAYATVIQPDGKVVVVGKNNVGTTTVQAAARYNTDGSLDNTFGTGGIVQTAIGASPTVSLANCVALEANGDLVAAGYALDTAGTKYDFSVTRYLGDSPSFLVTGFPGSITAGTQGSVTVTARNADGSTNSIYAGTVHFTSSDPRAVLPADYTFTAADQGTHTFGATLVTASSQSITVTDTATSTTFGGEAGIVVQPAAASQFILGAPSSVSKGAKFSLTLTVEDAYGNVVTGYVGTVHFVSSDGTATLPVDYTFTAADAGVHTFTNNAILRKKGNQTITVIDTLNSALTTTDSITVI